MGRLAEGADAGQVRAPGPSPGPAEGHASPAALRDGIVCKLHSATMAFANFPVAFLCF